MATRQSQRVCIYLLLLLISYASADVIPPVSIKLAKKPVFLANSGPVTYITRDQIAATGVTSLTQALQNLGGVQLHDMSGTGSQVLLSLRGFGANAGSNTLLLINGIPVTNPDLAPPDLNAIPLSEIESIEIISGSESVLYGDQAVGGVINIITRAQAKDQAGIICQAGSYDLRACDILLHHVNRFINLTVTANKYHSDNYRHHNQYDQNQVFSNLDYGYQTGSVNMNLSAVNEYMQYPGALTAQQVRQNRTQAANDMDYFKDWNSFVQLHHKQTLNTDWHMETDFAYRMLQGSGVLSLPFAQSRTVYYLKPQLKGTWNNVRLTTGFDIQDDRYHLRSMLGLSEDSHQKYGLFTMAKYPVNERLTLSAGLRGAQQNSYLRSFVNDDEVNRALATTIGLNYALVPDTNLYLRRAGSFRFPKADESASAFNGLRTQRGNAYETGAEINREKYDGKLELYQLNLTDEIAFDPTQTPLTPFGTNRNLDPTVRRGLTLAGKKHIAEKVTLDGQYNYVNAVFASGSDRNKRIPLVSAHVMRAGVMYDLNEFWHLYPEIIFTGDQYADNDNANVAGKIGGYTIYNVNIRYERKHFNASLRINNIFNKYYYLYTVYQPSLSSEYFYPAPDRNISLTLGYTFA